jgi:ATP-dependent DNA helicase RecQ
VLRTVAELDFRFGAGRTVLVLAGSESSDVLDRGLDRLPAYGILAGCDVRDVRTFVQFLEDWELLTRRPFQRRDGSEGGLVLGLSRQGRRFVELDVLPELPPAPVPRRRGRRADRGGTAAVAAEPAGPRLDEAARTRVEQLRAFRLRLARGKPAYTVFSNATLELLAAAPPTDRESFLAVKGLGPARWQAFGEELLAELGRADDAGLSEG